MGKMLKIAAGTVITVLVLALLAPMLLRGRIADIVRKEANDLLTARLDFERLDISLLRHFPNASLNLKGLTLVGEEPFAGDTIVAAERISVVVNLLSLVGDEGFEVRKVILDEPAVHARKLADGRVNWEVVKPSGEPETDEPEEAGSSSFRLSIHDFRIDGAAIRYEDDSTGLHFRTAPLSLRLRGDMAADATDLDLRLMARGVNLRQGAVPMLVDAETELNASIEADLKARRFTLSRNTLRLNAIEMELDGWAELRDEAVAMDLRAGCDKVQFKELLSLIPAFYTREFRNLSASGELDLSLWARGEMRGSELPAFELRTEVRNGSFRYASLPKSVTDINVAARIANPGGVMDRTEVELSKFGLKMAGNSLAATFYGTNLVSDPRFRASASGRVDLGAVKEVYPLEEGTELGGEITADVKVSGSMSAIEKGRYREIAAAGTFVVEGLGLTLPDLPAVQIRRAAATITPQAMTLGELGVTVGQSDLAANGQLTDYLGYLLNGDRLSGRLYVKSELLDLNEIMAAMPAGEEEQPAADEEPMHALVVPQNLDLSLNADLKRVLFGKMAITGIAGEMRMADGALSLDKLKLGVFGGRAVASGRYSTAEDPQRPSLKLAASVTDASFARTFAEAEVIQRLVPLFEKTGGNYSMSLDMTTRLDAAMSPELETLVATGEIRSADIEVQNIGVFDALAKVLKNDNLRRIQARDVAIRFAIRDGRIATQPFDLKMGDIRINMSGSTGLDQTIDYTARVALPAAATGGVLETMNVKIGGTFTAPKVTLGVKEAAQEAVKNLIEDQVQRLTGSETLSDEVEKQAARLREEAQRAGDKLVEAAEAQRDKLVEAAAPKGRLAKIAAEKAGDKLVDEARRQSERLVAEAEAQIEKLTGKKSE